MPDTQEDTPSPRKVVGTTDAPQDWRGEPIEFALNGGELPTNVYVSSRLWYVFVTKSVMVVCRGGSDAAALLGPVVGSLVQRGLQKRDVVGQTIGEVTRDCYPLMVFDRTKGPMRLGCYAFGKPGKTGRTLTLYFEDKMHLVTLHSESAAKLQAACPELALEPWPREGWKNLLGGLLGFPLLVVGGLTLCSLSFQRVGEDLTAEPDVPLSLILGVLMLSGSALLEWWSQRADSMEPYRRKGRGKWMIILGALGLVGTLFLMGQSLSGGPVRGWQSMLPACAAFNLAVAVYFIVFGIRSRRRGETERQERRKLQACHVE